MPDLVVKQGFNALSEQQKNDHRLKIGARAEVILSQFWRDDLPDALRALEIEGWIDVLENCSHSEIRKAWAIYQKTGPRTASGKLYKPDAGALYRIIMKSRPKPKVVDQSRPATTAENEAYAASAGSINPDRAAAADRIIKAAFGGGSGNDD